MRRFTEDRGTSLVEFAIVAPLLFLLLFGIIEFGLAFKNDLTISSASREGARVGAAAGRNDGADHFILQSVETALTGVDIDDVVSVRVYDRDAAGNSNTYTRGGGCHGWSPCADPNSPSYNAGAIPWAPSARNDVLSDDPIAPPLTRLAVEVTLAHDWVTDFIPGLTGTRNLTNTTTMRLEPQVFG